MKAKKEYWGALPQYKRSGWYITKTGNYVGSLLLAAATVTGL
jgi:hypothetical protein